MLQTISHKIRLGFSKSAKTYDLFSSLHREIADSLLVCVIREPEPSALLDVGCGTGYLTGKLKDHYPQSRIIGLDFAQGMLNRARSKNKDIDWVLADANHLPFNDGSINMVVSNLAYQWADDLSQVFNEARRVLVPNGVLACTLFGFNTCRELFQSLDEVTTGPLHFTRLPQGTEIHEALIKSGFKKPKVDSEQIKIEFKDMHELTAWLKVIGANNLPREGYLGAEALSRAASIYHKKFSCPQGIESTFEVVRVYVQK